MTNVLLRITCDYGASPNFGVTLGVGWARVHLCLPPPADWVAAVTPSLQTSKAMLDFVGVAAGLPVRPRVVIDGPDAPTGVAEVDDAICRVFNVWASLLRPASALPTPAPTQPSQPTPTTPHTPLRLEPARAGPSEPSGRGRVSSAATATATSTVTAVSKCADDATVRKMVETIQTYVEQYGAAPDFRSGKPAAREKAYNYIRSTCADMRASDEVVEAVRRRLVNGASNGQ
jgi:hypothetical protein